MDDLREKVINGLERCSQMAGEVCRECPYANECEEGEGLLAGSAHLAADALSLLKAQEEEIQQLKAMNISASDNAVACGVIHSGLTINQKAKEIMNIKNVEVFNG